MNLMSDNGDGVGLWTFRTLFNSKTHTLSLFETAIPGALNRAEMDKYVVTGVRFDEAKTFVGIEPLYGALLFRHGKNLVVETNIQERSPNACANDAKLLRGR